VSVYGEWLAATISSGGMESSAVDLGRDYDYISIQIPELNGDQLYLKVSETLAGTYYDLGGEDTTLHEMTVFKESPISNEEDGHPNDVANRADSLRLGGWRFVKVCALSPQSADRSIRVRGMRY